MASQDQQNIDDINAILEDCVRMQQLAREDPKAALQQSDPWLQLPHPSGNGSLFSSAESAERIDALAERARASRGLERRVALKNVKEPLKKELVKRFVTEKRDIDQRQTARLLAWTAKAAERKCKPRTFYLPVRFTLNTEPEIVRIGPVSLVTRELAGAKLAPAMRRYVRDSKSADDQKWQRRHLQDALEYYRHFKWVAEVTIQGCDHETAEIAATHAVGSALDFLHIILSRHYTDKVKLGGLGLSADRQAQFILTGDEDLYVSTSHGGFEQVGFGEGWSKLLKRDDIAEMFRLAGVALECRVDRTIDRPMSERYLDAAMWFGEAVRDSVLSSRAVKYVTAIERIVTAGKTADVNQTVATRTADMLFDPDNPQYWASNRNKVLEAYDLRSDLVHGTISPHDKGVVRGVGHCGDVAEELLIAALHRFGDQALQFGSISNSRYAAWFGDIRDYVDSALKQLLPDEEEE